MDRATDERWMRLALSLGARGLGRVWPNPAVGCVIVRDGRVLGRGFTQRGGRPHAERVALDQAAEARGATAYVTLEPCAHHGKTPPCADALIAAGVARVVVALGDPDPRVNGQGIQRLRDAGICVETGVLEAQARHDQRGFLSRVTKGRPMVTLKLATSFDGRIATASGDSQWITGPRARRMVHAMRASHDAVMVGAGTARDDDPTLTVRGLGTAHQPVRVVCSGLLDLPMSGNLARTAHEVPLLLIHGRDAPLPRRAAWEEKGATLQQAEKGGGGQLDPASILSALGQAGLTRVLVEGGGMLAASLLGAELVDELVGFTAGLALGAEGRPSIGPLGLGALAEAERFTLSDASPIGPDVLHRWVKA